MIITENGVNNMYDFKDKNRNVNRMVDYMYTRSLGMFSYSGLPDTIPEVELEKILQMFGYGFFYEHNGELYVFHGSLTGEHDIYNNPTEINVNNLYLNLNDTIKLENGVLIKNDDLMLGLNPLFEKYNYMLNENEISMILNTINSRIQNLMTASDDKTRESAQKFLDKVESGELSIISESQILEGLKVHNVQNNNSQSMINLIEFQQYIKATMYNDIGIDLNFNMKRERLISGEVEQNTDILFPLVNQMFKNRQHALEQVNKKYGTNITVEYSSVWKHRNLDEPEPELELEPETEPEPETESDEVGDDDENTV